MRLSRFLVTVWAVLVVSALGFSVEAGELLVNGDFSQEWTVGWGRWISEGAGSTETVSSSGKVMTHLNGLGDLYLYQAVEISSVSSLDLKFRVRFKPQSIENLLGLGWHGWSYVALAYGGKDGKPIGFTRLLDLNCWCCECEELGAQPWPKNTPTRHFIRVENGAWTQREISVQQELRDYLPGVDPQKIAYVVVLLGLWGPREESEAILEVDYASLIGPDADRVVSIADISDAVNDTVRAAITLNTKEGGENALGFSLVYDSKILGSPSVILGRDAINANIVSNSNQVTGGRYGILVALPAGEVFAPGIYQLAVVKFVTLAGNMVDSTMISFGDQPITREVADVNAVALSSVSWSPGAVRISRGYEADVAPRSGPDNKCTIADWTQVGRFVAGLDVIVKGKEFQRADCAPRTSLGNGQLTVADWTQAGRYVAGLDPLTPAGGLMEPALAKPIVSEAEVATTGTSVVRVVSTNLKRGETGSLRIELDAQGSENALGFSLLYDPEVLRFEQAVKGSAATDALLLVNAGRSADGYIGVALALPSGQAFSPGVQTVLEVRFTAISGSAVSTNVNFADQPVEREVVDVFARAVAVSFAGAIVTLGDIMTAVETIKQTLPVSYALLQNSPNPFNSATTISYVLPEAADISLGIYDLSGRLIRSLANGYQQSGSYVVAWDGQDEERREVSSGVYFYRLETAGREFVETKRMLLLR